MNPFPSGKLVPIIELKAQRTQIEPGLLGFRIVTFKAVLFKEHAELHRRLTQTRRSQDNHGDSVSDGDSQRG
jgi:trehalose-6-phosphate synthase